MLKSAITVLLAVAAPLFTTAAPADVAAENGLDLAVAANTTAAAALAPYKWHITFYEDPDTTTCIGEEDFRAGYARCYPLFDEIGGVNVYFLYMRITALADGCHLRFFSKKTESPLGDCTGPYGRFNRADKECKDITSSFSFQAVCDD